MLSNIGYLLDISLFLMSSVLLAPKCLSIPRNSFSPQPSEVGVVVLCTFHEEMKRRGLPLEKPFSVD
jgi:hypothetical protein